MSSRPVHLVRRRRGHQHFAGAVSFAAIGLLIGVGCASSGSTKANTPTTATNATAPANSPDSATPTGTYALGQTTRTFVDTSRPTDAHGDEAAKPERTLETLIIYPTKVGGSKASTTTPAQDAPALDGPWPVIIFGHGSTRKPADYLGKLTYWASAGYVIVAPAFPLSKEGTPGGTSYGDYPNQTGDEAFLIDKITTDDTAPLKLASLIDGGAIGVGGQSFGAITAQGLVAAKCCADKRVKATTSFAGAWLPYPSKDELAPWAAQIPVLFVHGSDDPTLPYDGDRKFFERLGAPGGFLTLVGSGHDPGYFDATNSPLDTLVSEATLAFYDQHLKAGPDSTPIIEKLVKDAGPKVATFTPSP